MQVLHQKLLKVSALEFQYKNHPTTKFDLQEFLLYFEQNNLHIKCDSVGVGLELSFNKEELMALDLGAWGRLTVINCSYSSEFQKIIGLTLLHSNKIFCDQDIVGRQLVFQNSMKICFINLGDELFICEDLPISLLQDHYHILEES